MIIDTPWNTIAALPALRQAGVRAIIRYYNHSNSSVLPEKRLEPNEADAIRAAGMKIGVVFQQRQNDPVDFTADKGRAALARALDLAERVAQPAGSAIYFGVDRDFVSGQHLLAIRRYFGAIGQDMADQPAQRRYRIGAYGSGKVLQNLLDHDLIELCWLAQSTGWSGFQAFRESGRWHLLQGPVTAVAGLDCDRNEEAAGGFGAF